MSTDLTTNPGPADFDLTSGQAIAADCTHCGLCLESCPTYTLWAREEDSPRGRIVLIEDAIAGGGSISSRTAAHIDTCLGCMACVSACPEGVRYDELIGKARVAVARQRELPVSERLRRRLKLEVRARSGRVRELARTQLIPHFTPAHGPSRGRVGLLLGCTQRAAFAPVHMATLGVLAAEGYEVVAPKLPECCGAFEFDDGQPQRAAHRAQATIAAFSAVGGIDHVIVSAGGCGAAMKNYGRLLGTPQARAFSALVLDVHELLTREPARAPRGPLSLRVAYHDACKLKHAQGISDAPRQLLRSIPELQLTELPPSSSGECCGGPGTYPTREPEASSALAARQARALLATGAQVIASGDHACLAQLSRELTTFGKQVAVHHPIELLWASIQGGEGGKP